MRMRAVYSYSATVAPGGKVVYSTRLQRHDSKEEREVTKHFSLVRATVRIGQAKHGRVLHTSYFNCV
jgi:hypothetical protein